MMYDYSNQLDAPSPNIMASGGVNYDTFYQHRDLPATTNFYYIRDIREYDNNNRLIKTVDISQRINLYRYDAAGRLQAKYFMQYTASGPMDTVYRNEYFYDASGNLRLDSMGQYYRSSGTYTPLSRVAYQMRSDGRPLQATTTQLSGTSSGLPLVLSIRQFNYDTSGDLETIVTQEADPGSGSLAMKRKDSVRIVGGVLTHYDGFDYNPGTATWVQAYEYRSWLNATGVPDSLHARFIGGTMSQITRRIIFQYDVDNDPAIASDYLSGNATPDRITYWRYTMPPPAPLGLPHTPGAHALVVAPNPLQEGVLRLGKYMSGAYSICDMSGRLIQSSTLSGTAIISVPRIAPGQYLLKVRDKQGQLYQARFMHQ
jgi:YD repeat-containing protein